jgi:hypothetical protein
MFWNRTPIPKPHATAWKSSAAPNPPTIGSGVKPPPPPPDQWWELDPRKKQRNFQVFNSQGAEIYSATWQPTGNFRIRVGWFGRAIVEEEFAFIEYEGTAFPPPRDWRRADRDKILKLAGARNG